MDFEGAVYEAALALDASERQDFLERVFDGDAEGLGRIRALLKVAGKSSAYFIEASERRSVLASEILQRVPADPMPGPEDAPSPSEELGSLIGSYRLISRIGEGGCGVVYEAEQQEPVRRRVALKIIRLGMDTERVIARFRAERQALALMDHPNIARVFDAGATAAGRPYFVMERVPGERITVSCDDERLDLATRINLFIRVCNAIQHAHQKGVIHRDIKPSNVLVIFLDGVPVPKVIDFGIAKAAWSHDADRRPFWTTHDQIMGTPPYMSPEQVDMSGIDIDTRSDIYSLGALLHELLGGRAPFDGEALAAAGVSEMRRILLEQEPPPLSRMLGALPAEELAKIASLRREEPARLISLVRGDLDWIIAKAMAKDRNHRYQTVSGFVADLQRFLDDQPVLARRPGRYYLLGKFIRRNRAACISGAAVAISLLAGMAASTYLYFNEHQALAEQQRLRTQAQARANVSQAAVMLSEGRINEADALLRKSPLESIEPSREAAGVFRALGNWNAFYGRWKQAGQCYWLLNEANRLDQPVDIVEQCEVLAIASAFLEDGNLPAYTKFRQEMLRLYLPAQNSLQAEHLLQACLLTPADAATMKILQEVAKVCAYGPSPDLPAGRWPDWEAFAMTLYYHRLGQVADTLAWGNKCLSFPKSLSGSGDARVAGTLCLTAIARARSGDASGARDDLRRARELIADGMREGPGREPSEPGLWYSWVIARMLLKEADMSIKVPS